MTVQVSELLEGAIFTLPSEHNNTLYVFLRNTEEGGQIKSVIREIGSWWPEGFRGVEFPGHFCQVGDSSEVLCNPYADAILITKKAERMVKCD